MFGQFKKLLYFCGMEKCIKKTPPIGGVGKHYENIYI